MLFRSVVDEPEREPRPSHDAVGEIALVATGATWPTDPEWRGRDARSPDRAQRDGELALAAGEDDRYVRRAELFRADGRVPAADLDARRGVVERPVRGSADDEDARSRDESAL